MKTTLHHHVALTVHDEAVSVPPRSGVIVPVCTGYSDNNEGIIEGNTQLLFDRGHGDARGIARFRNGKAEVLVTNVSEEYRHLKIGTMIAFLDEMKDIIDASAISDRPADDSPYPDHTPGFDNNPA